MSTITPIQSLSSESENVLSAIKPRSQIHHSCFHKSRI